MSTTDDTRQRSVAEIIGWTYVDNPRYADRWGEPAQLVMTPDGQLWNTSKQPTPDDMLAWLRGRLRDPEWNAEAGLNIYVSDEGVSLDWYDAGGGDGLSHPEPTLHAALEAAVRAVAEASDE